MTHQRTIRHSSLLLIALVVLLGAWPRPASAQEVPRAALGAGLGVLGGVGITVAKVVARAHVQNEYLNEPGDLIHWQSVSMILAPAAGAAFGLHSWDALGGGFIGSASGFVVGVGVGAFVGSLMTDTPEGPWAGGAIGGGLGLAIGGLVGGYIGWRQHEGEGVPVSLEVQVPAGLLLPAGRR
jgi:hypothetical protein